MAQSRSSSTLSSLAALFLLTSSTFALPAPVPRPQITNLADAAAIPLPDLVARQDYKTFNSDPPSVPTYLPDPNDFPSGVRGGKNLIGYNPSNPVETEPSTQIPPSDFQLAPGQTEDADIGLYLDFNGVENFQPIRGSTDSPTDPGPRTMQYELLNSDLFAPPGTDSGSVMNAKWPLGLSHNRHGSPNTAGWARQENVDDLPIATAMAGVDMRLSPGAYRELHWHKANEWSLMLNGSVRLYSSNTAGENFEDTISAGDVWFFPAGIPHSIQALDDGAEFLLIFDDGSFSDSGTSLVSELFERMPKSVLAKNFRTDVSAFDNLPTGELYIFPSTETPNATTSAQNTTGPAGIIPQNLQYTYHLSEQQPFEVPGGSIKVLDSQNFPIASNFAGALVTIKPGAMREIHWHPTSDEWNYCLSGSARFTIYSAPDSSATFDLTAGDVGYIPSTQAHYLENTGTDDFVYLEMLLAPRFTDISVGQWLALVPPYVVKDTLHLPDSVIANLPKTKPFLLPGNPNLLTTNFTGEPL